MDQELDFLAHVIWTVKRQFHRNGITSKYNQWSLGNLQIIRKKTFKKVFNVWRNILNFKLLTIQILLNRLRGND